MPSSFAQRAWIAPALLLVAAAALACSEAAPKNAVVIVVDTLRRDHLGAYGYARDTSPHLDTLAAEGTRFDRAYATAPWTQPSVASMLTGLHPGSHGADRLLRSLPAAARTLPEILAAEGYATGCVVSHFLVGPRFGFDQGCETMIHGSALGVSAFSTPGVTERGTELLEAWALERRPFLLWLHYFDPHYEYRRHPGTGFAAGAVGRLDGEQSVAELRSLAPPPSDAEAGFVRDLYDEEVRFTDAGIGRLLRRLEHIGLAKQTVVVVVADHGEEFWERGWLGHTRSLHDELLRVPLVIRAPGAPAGRVATAPVSLVGLVPTLLELLDIETDTSFQAGSFASLVTGTGRRFEPEPVLGETEFWRQALDERVSPAVRDRGALRAVGADDLVRRQALVQGRHKLIRDPATGAVELYDLERDPEERDDLALRESGLARELTASLELRIRETHGARLEGAAAPDGPTDEERALLRSLGYRARAPSRRPPPAFHRETRARP